MLAVEFDKNPDWSKERLFELSTLTGLSEAQIYKWGWDQRRKVCDGEGVSPLPQPQQLPPDSNS
jgi:predicted DNA-binding transcriptional regulator AlpA